MLKAVLDTNVIVSGIISERGIPFQLLEAWRERKWDLLISPRILQELQRVLSFPKIARVYALTRQDITDLIWLFSPTALHLYRNTWRFRVPPAILKMTISSPAPKMGRPTTSSAAIRIC